MSLSKRAQPFSFTSLKLTNDDVQSICVVA